MRPRLSDGAWMTPYQPELPDGFREGTGWQYTWLVPHDIGGLFEAIGARGNTSSRTARHVLLDAVDRSRRSVVPEAQQKITVYGIAYYGNQYAPSNEHDLQAPYAVRLDSSRGRRRRSPARTRRCSGRRRTGFPGNDDLGSMSAWFVWSALGFYPEIAGAPVYTVGSPVFERAKIASPAGSSPSRRRERRSSTSTCSARLSATGRSTEPGSRTTRSRPVGLARVEMGITPTEPGIDDDATSMRPTRSPTSPARPNVAGRRGGRATFVRPPSPRSSQPAELRLFALALITPKLAVRL